MGPRERGDSERERQFMTEWYNISRDAAGRLVVAFLPHPQNRWFPANVLQDLDLPVATGDQMVLTGPGAAWMYFHAACKAAALSADRIAVRLADGATVPVYPLESRLPVKWCRVSEDVAASEQLVEFSGEEVGPADLTALPLREDVPLRITGRAAVWMYAAVGAQAAKLPAALYDSPREAELISVGLRQTGMTVPRRNAPHELGVVIGVVGDPNSGKSVLAKGLFEVLRAKVQRSWAYDCDAASPTPNWYLSLLNSETFSQEKTKKLRDGYKVEWTPELEANVARQLASLKRNLAFTLADLPGGRHPKEGKSFLPERIPPTREAMFRNIDLFIVLGCEGRPDIVDAWRQALEEGGCGGRVIAELVSSEPDTSPRFSGCARRGLVIRGTICGLDRSHRREAVAEALQEFGAELLDSIRCWKLVGQARGAVARAFLTREGGIRYGAAAVSADNRTFVSGQYSSFNHVTNVHAEQAVLAAAAATGSADVVALAIASTEPDATARPCGVCRQVMSEHAARTGRDFTVVMVDHRARLDHCEICRVSELLPHAWQSHRQSAGRTPPGRNAQPQLQGFETKSRLTTGAHVELPGGALALVWDPQFGDAALVKVKYRPLPDGTWDKLPHSFSDGRRYLAMLHDLGLAATTFCGATAALASANEIRRWAPPAPVAESSLPPVLTSCLADAGISSSRLRYTGSRALGLAGPASDHDLIVQASPDEIRGFRQRCADALSDGRMFLPPSSGTWSVLHRAFPGGREAILRGRRFLETVSEDGVCVALIFTPPEEDRLDTQGWVCLGWSSVCGRVEDDRSAAYKRARFQVRTMDGRRVDVVSYHKLASLVRTGDTLSLGGWLLGNPHAAVPFRLYQLTAASDNLIWMDAVAC